MQSLGEDAAATVGGRLLVNTVAGMVSADTANGLTQLTGNEPFSTNSFVGSTMLGGLGGGAIGLLMDGVAAVSGVSTPPGILQYFSPAVALAGGGTMSAVQAIGTATSSSGSLGVLGGITGALADFFSMGTANNAANDAPVDTDSIPSGSYDQPGGGRTDILQGEDHGARVTHTHDPIMNTNPNTGRQYQNGLRQPGRPVSQQDIDNISSGAAPRSKPKGRR